MNSLRTEFQKELSRRSKEVLIKEAIIAIVAEQAIDQQQALQQAAPIAPPNPPVSPDAPPPAQPPVDGAATGEVTVDTIIDKLNVIRGGSSFSDPEVYGQLTTFWNSIPEPQRVTLDSQLNSIGKIVSIAEPQEAGAAPAAGGTTPPNAPPAQAPGGVPVGGSAPISPTQPGF